MLEMTMRLRQQIYRLVNFPLPAARSFICESCRDTSSLLEIQCRTVQNCVEVESGGKSLVVKGQALIVEYAQAGLLTSESGRQGLPLD